MGGQIVGLFSKNLPANHEPSELPVVVSPRSIELCFQTVSLSSLALQSRLGLPHAFRELRIVSASETEGDAALFSVIAPNSDGTYDAKMVDEKGNLYLILSGYRLMDLPDPVQPELLVPLKSAFETETM
jgi:hypothetical protein